MSQLEALTAQFVGLVWGLPLVVTLVSAGIIFSLYFGFPQVTMFKHAIDIVRGKYDKPEDEGEISHFQALTTALSATVGLGNIAGVAVAVSVGGPGAVFWMWIAGFIGMTTKFTEVTLALQFRDKGESHISGNNLSDYLIELERGIDKKLLDQKIKDIKEFSPFIYENNDGTFSIIIKEFDKKRKAKSFIEKLKKRRISASLITNKFIDVSEEEHKNNRRTDFQVSTYK